MWPDHNFLKSRLVFHMFYIFYSDISFKNRRTQTFALINPFFFRCGLTSFLQALCHQEASSDFDTAHLLWKYQKGSSSKQYSSWAYSLISCIISSRTFVTDTTYIGFQFGFFFLFFFLGRIPTSHSYFLFSEYIAQYFIIKKGFKSQAKSFSPSLRRC